MAKAKKTTRKSTTSKTSKPKASTKKKSLAKKTPKKTEKKTDKKPELICQFCEKPMKDEKTKKVHESNCKKKKEEKEKKPPKKDLEEAVAKLKDEFEDQKRVFSDRFTEREDRLHEEIRELKEVLRLEIEHRHKERERRKREESETAAAEAVLEEVAEAIDKEMETSEETAREPEPSPIPVAQPPTQIPAEDAPRAIDMIPTPVPEIPPPKSPEQIAPGIGAASPEEVTVETAEIPPSESKEVAAEEPAVQPEAESEPKIDMDREAIVTLIREELGKKDEEKAGPVIELDGITGQIDDLSTEVKTLKRDLETTSSNLRKTLDKIEYDAEFKRIERELNKFSEKIAEIMDEIGFGEQLNVSKIPPTILEIVYQATLDDLTLELARAMGTQDAEKVSRAALEEVRLKTSGSELFKFDGRKIVTDNLAHSIEANLISAKQIQTTYDELLSRLLENLPHHKAKNFRAMIKVKSQEFAVDRATMLTKHTDRLENVLETSSQMLAALSAQLNSIQLELREELDDIKNNMILTKAEASDIDLIKIKMNERDEREAKLMKDLSLLRAEVEMGKKLAKKDEKPKMELGAEVKPTEDKPAKKEEEVKEEPPKDEAETSTLEADVLKAISDGAGSKTAIKKSTGLKEKEILEAVSKLVKDKRIIEKKAGKRISYMTPDKELEDKIKKKEKPKEEKKPEVPEVIEGEDIIVVPEGPPEEEPKTKKGPKKKAGDKMAMEEPEKKPKKAPKKEPEKKEEKTPPKKAPKKEPKKKEEKKPEKKAEDEKKAPSEKAKEKIEEKAPKKEAEEEPKPEKEKPEPEKPVEEMEPEVSKEPEEPVEPKEPDPEKAPDKKPKKEPEKEPEEPEISIPTESKGLDELSEEERMVLEAITEDGLTRSGIQSKVGKDLNYTTVLRALRVLIDSGYVGIVTKGRLTLYQKISVKEMDKPEKEKNKKEVK